ncbi:MAG TPA: pyroglutamyl-peptidase I [Candidatus Blautia avistercoris]|nr:pyroglutamyl-peptidase I [Candidatus Blautia avistercoris]
MKILVTGFEPFEGNRRNASLEGIKLLPDYMGDAKIIKARIPTAFKAARQRIEALLEQEKPDRVISVGLAGGDSFISVEKAALNLIEARILDNDGEQPFDTPVREDGENAYFVPLPVKRIAQAIRQRGIPAKVSYSAGTFVCNFLLYDLLYLAQKKYPEMKCGFLHVPYDEETAGQMQEEVPCLAIEQIKEGILTALEVLINQEEELQQPAGSIF